MEIEGTVGSTTEEEDNEDRRQKVPSKTLKCDMCEFKTKWRTSLLRHKIIHSNTLLICDLCASKFPNMSSLHKHKRAKHENGILYSHCSKVFKSNQGFRQHMKTVNGTINYRCEVCDKTFINKSHYEGHMNGHRNYKPFKCLNAEGHIHIMQG